MSAVPQGEPQSATGGKRVHKFLQKIPIQVSITSDNQSRMDKSQEKAHTEAKSEDLEILKID